MKRNRRNLGMLIATVTMGIIAFVLVFIGYYKGERQHVSGLRSAMNMTIEIVPLLIFAFITAGTIQALLSEQMVAKWWKPNQECGEYSLVR